MKMQISIRFGYRVLLFLAFLLATVGAGMPTAASAQSGSSDSQENTLAGNKVFLSFVRNGASSALPLMIGIYPGSWYTTALPEEMKPLDDWLTGVTGGRKTTLYGTFTEMEIDSSNGKGKITDPFTQIWNAGYVPFINMEPHNASAYTIATSSSYDTYLTNWARAYKTYANGGTRFAYIAPMQEMNGEWVSYGKDPGNFKIAYARVRSIFAREGVPAKSVKWGFAPNGWTNTYYLGLPLVEQYYPGDSSVDVVAFSAYNYGYCKDKAVWEEPEVVFNNPNLGPVEGYYLNRLRAMAPSKPIFIAQTATSSYRYPQTKNAAEKERWLRDAYVYLSKQPNVRAIIYFNTPGYNDPNCDWKVFLNGSYANSGYKDGINNGGYKYIAPGALLNIDHTYR